MGASATPLPPLTQPLVGPGGALTPAWQWYFYEIYLQSGGSLAALQVLEAFDAASGDNAASVAADSTVLAAAGDPVPSIAAPIDAIRKQLASIAETPDQSARIDALEKLIWSLTGDSSAAAAGATPVVIVDTHANRAGYVLADYPDGAVYFETDRTVVYVAGPPDSAAAWLYAAGTFSAVLADIPTDLGAGDAGFQFASTDLAHVWIWSGSVWHFAPWDSGSRYIVGFGTGSPPGGVWGYCDGSSYYCANDDGTSANVATPDLSTNAILQGGSYSGNIDGATTPSFNGGALTNQDAGAGQAVQSGTGVIVAAHPHQHPLQESNAMINSPSESNGGMPPRVKLGWWIRR